MQTHFSYTSFYFIVVSNPTYCFLIYLGLIYLIKSHNCQINSIITAITINHLDQPIYYNTIIKLVTLILLKGIYYQNS